MRGDSQNREKQKSKRISRAGGEGSKEVLEVLAARRRAVIDFDEKRKELSFIIETNTRRARNIERSHLACVLSPPASNDPVEIL